jgi:CTP:molybdopterin cytidylyltransferase MocA
VSTLAVILAAGEGSRFTGPTPKLLAPLGGTPLVRWAIDHAVEADLGEVVVVVGAVELGDVVPPGVKVLRNDRWAEGQSTSLAVAVAHARVAGHDAIVVALGDQPGIEPAAWRAVAAATTPIAIATYGGKRGHPVRLASEVWPDLPASGDEGARALLRGRDHVVGEVPCHGRPGDIDTVEDLDRWS